jgi:LAO/AO transport system kinase
MPTIGLSERNVRLADGLLKGDMASLAKGITLIESTKEEHRRQAELFTEYVMAHSTPPKGFKNSGCTLRLGIAGPPGMIQYLSCPYQIYVQHKELKNLFFTGAGKSTFIENLGMRFIKDSQRVAVIPVDPSSHISGGTTLQAPSLC